MGGELDYAPNPGDGSVFTFTALFDHGADDGSGDRAGSAEDARARELLAGRRALVVDDDDDQPADPGRAGRLVGHGRRDGASSAAEAGALLERTARYDVVLLDLAVPATRTASTWPGGCAPTPRSPTCGCSLLTSATDAGRRRAARRRGRRGAEQAGACRACCAGSLLHLLTGEPMDPRSRTGRPRAPSRARGSILVVEDNPVNQMVATGLLAALGYASDVGRRRAGRDRGGARAATSTRS